MSEVKTDSVVNVSGDNDSGIDLSTNDVVAIKTADSERVRVDASGKVGIGTTSPDNSLHVQNSDFATLKLEHTNTSGTQICDVIGESNGTQKWRLGKLSSGSDDFMVQTGTTERMRVGSDGKIRLANTAMNFDSSSNTATGLTTGTSGLTHICTGSGNAQLVCQKTSPSGDENMIVFLRGSTSAGQIRTNSSNEVLYQNNSDHRLKENVSDMTGAIARVKQLTPKRFSYISDPDSTIVDGFLAHEAQTVVPNAVSGTHNEVDADGNAVMQGFDQSKLVPLLVGALKESIAKIEALEARVTALEDA